MHKAPKDKARRTARVAAFTPMLWRFEKDLPTEWSRMVAADGATGYLKNVMMRRECRKAMCLLCQGEGPLWRSVPLWLRALADERRREWLG